VLDDCEIAALVGCAIKAREAAYALYSGFRVGAAVVTSDDRVYFGCNIENASYSLSICAERAAITSAVVAGARRIRAVIIVTDASPPGTPCGACRQWIQEFGCGSAEIISANCKGEYNRYTLAELLPEPFRLEK